MSQKIMIGTMFILAIVLGVVGILSEPGSFGMGCYGGGILCNNFFVPLEGALFLTISIPLLLTTPILFFVRREIFLAWIKFAVVAFPIMLGVLLYTYSTPNGYGFFGFDFGTDEMYASILLPTLFVVISLAIIIAKLLRLRRPVSTS